MENNIENNIENNNKLNLGSQNMVEDKMLNEISGGQKTFLNKHWKEIVTSVSVVGTIALVGIAVVCYKRYKYNKKNKLVKYNSNFSDLLSDDQLDLDSE